jgi:hypothetical protein
MAKLYIFIQNFGYQARNVSCPKCNNTKQRKNVCNVHNFEADCLSKFVFVDRMLARLVWYMFTYNSEEHVYSIFRAVVILWRQQIPPKRR